MAASARIFRHVKGKFIYINKLHNLSSAVYSENLRWKYVKSLCKFETIRRRTEISFQCQSPKWKENFLTCHTKEFVNLFASVYELLIQCEPWTQEVFLLSWFSVNVIHRHFLTRTHARFVIAQFIFGRFSISTYTIVVQVVALAFNVFN